MFSLFGNALHGPVLFSQEIPAVATGLTCHSGRMLFIAEDVLQGVRNAKADAALSLHTRYEAFAL